MVYHFEDKVFTCELPGAKDILLSEILTGLEIVSEEDSAAFLAEIANVETSNEKVFRLAFDEEGWKFRVLKESEEPESLIVTLLNGQKYVITVSAAGNTELAAEDGSTVISTVDNYYLPEEASVYAEILSSEQSELSISAVQELTGKAGEESACQVYSIGLDNVDETAYEGFEVEISLTEELSGKDFRLYQIRNGEATDITDHMKLNAEMKQDGSQTVRGFSFTTGTFAEYALSYSLVTYYTTFDGITYRIMLNYGPEAGIPDDAELKVREILPEDEAYQTYLTDSAAVSGANSGPVGYARFFDIQIWADAGQVEPAAPVSVSISLDDAPDLTGTEFRVVHFAQDGPEIMEAEALNASDILFRTEGFSVYGVIVEEPIQSANDLDGRSAMISNRNWYLTSQNVAGNPTGIGKTQSVSDAAAWTFEAVSGGYYIYTTVNGEKQYIHITYYNAK